MTGRLLTALVFAMLAVAVQAQDIARIVYIGVEDDPAYEPQPVYTGLSLKDRQRPIEGARVAMRGTRVLGRALGLTFELDEILVQHDAPVGPTLRGAWEAGALALLLDLPASTLTSVLGEVSTSKGAVFNIRHTGARWRGTDCRPNLFHTIPSEAMLQDALAQHLRDRGWSRVLLLAGTAAGDAEKASAVRASAAKFGLKIVDQRLFELSNDPRNRDRNNIAILTGGRNHDVVWLVDTEGEFGRYVPFATQAARPVIGSEGLRPEAWHWTLERYGAPQLNQRFRRQSDRNMSSGDWAAWAAVRAVIEALQRVDSAEPGAISAFLASEEFRLDLYKGAPGSFRSWNGQLRQPIVLASHNAVIGLAPIEGFEHRTDTLDTLGVDGPENTCTR